MSKGNPGQITNEDLDDFLAAGSAVLRGVTLIPEGSDESPWTALPSAPESEPARGNILPTDYTGVNEKDDMQRRIALARHFLK
jgi:hypothetical protein